MPLIVSLLASDGRVPHSIQSAGLQPTANRASHGGFREYRDAARVAASNRYIGPIIGGAIGDGFMQDG